MTAILPRLVADQQPRSIAQINPNLPLARGLIAAVSLREGAPVDLITQRLIPVTGKPAQTPQGLQTSTDNAASEPFPASRNFMGQSTILTICTPLVLPVAAPGDTTPLAGIVSFEANGRGGGGPFINNAGNICGGLLTSNGLVYLTGTQAALGKETVIVETMALNVPGGQKFVKLFQDGKKTNSGYPSNANDDWNGTSWLFNIGGGSTNPGYRYFNGMVRLALVWDRVLSDAEIAEISRNPWQVFEYRRTYEYNAFAAIASVTSPVQSIAISAILPRRAATRQPRERVRLNNNSEFLNGLKCLVTPTSGVDLLRNRLITNSPSTYVAPIGEVLSYKSKDASAKVVLSGSEGLRSIVDVNKSFTIYAKFYIDPDVTANLSLFGDYAPGYSAVNMEVYGGYVAGTNSYDFAVDLYNSGYNNHRVNFSAQRGWNEVVLTASINGTALLLSAKTLKADTSAASTLYYSNFGMDGAGSLVLLTSIESQNYAELGISIAQFAVWQGEFDVAKQRRLLRNSWQIFEADRASAPAAPLTVNAVQSIASRAVLPRTFAERQPQQPTKLNVDFLKAPALIVSGNAGTPYLPQLASVTQQEVGLNGIGFRSTGTQSGLAWKTNEKVPVSGSMPRTFFARVSLNQLSPNTSIIAFGSQYGGVGGLFSLCNYNGGIMIHFYGYEYTLVGSPVLGAAYDVAVTNDGATTYLYVDGKPIFSQARVLNTTPTALYSGGPDEYFQTANNGVVWIAGVIARCLDAREIAELAKNPYKVFESNQPRLRASALSTAAAVATVPSRALQLHRYATRQPRNIPKLAKLNRLTQGALAIISSGHDMNIVSGIPLARLGSGHAKIPTIKGLASKFRNNNYLATEVLPAIGSGAFVEFWHGVPISYMGASGSGIENVFLTGSSNADGTGISLSGSRGGIVATNWGAVASWAGIIIDSGEILPLGVLTTLVRVRSADGFTHSLWHDGKLVKTQGVGSSPVAAKKFIVGSFVEDTGYWTSSSDTVLAGIIKGEWTAAEVQSFCENPWQLFEPERASSRGSLALTTAVPPTVPDVPVYPAHRGFFLID